jgi:CRISPR-associated protein Cas1
MKKLLNVLYITYPDVYLALEGQAIQVRKEEKTILKLPLLNLENIVCFNYPGVSPALMRACCDNNIGLCFLSPGGRFLGRVSGKVKGNVLLRKKQYQISDDLDECLNIGSSFLIGKFYNCRKILNRAIRDHALVVDCDELSKASESIKTYCSKAVTCNTIHDLMGLEGIVGRTYYSVFNELILHQREEFFFINRSRRPPMDNMNSLLSFYYVLLANEVTGALETVGLDPYVGFMHRERPGRPSLALDLMEELRPVFADRLALSLVNRRQVKAEGFVQKESGGILMNDETKKIVLEAWQERKKQQLTHPFLNEKIPFGLIPYVQALLLARYLRGDLDAYPPFFWS